MKSMKPYVYEVFSYATMIGDINLETAPLYVMLVGAKYVPARKHSTIADVKDEAKGDGYDAGGKLLEGKRIDKVIGGGKLRGDTMLWHKTSIDAAGAIVYDKSTGMLITYFDFGGTRASTNGDFELTWDAEGILELVRAKE